MTLKICDLKVIIICIYISICVYTYLNESEIVFSTGENQLKNKACNFVILIMVMKSNKDWTISEIRNS